MIDAPPESKISTQQFGWTVHEEPVVEQTLRSWLDVRSSWQLLLQHAEDREHAELQAKAREGIAGADRQIARLQAQRRAERELVQRRG